ncbi:hypothetical protein LTR37_006256 [Vermiconidia calcicola]|uniref:Uncharacterized protein n=1 Tax=Vermiconidia calcicola TaxID=1690605 RepID=A0ACC3NGI0_9PEZI|nr:hypothetical protein LTR37_006256 [Vermiconidia calcicola]
MENSIDVPVLIVGAGPSGATLALLLGKLGIKTLVISKHRNTANTPRAHVFNQRAMEVLRDAGVETMAKELACSSLNMQHTTWSNTLAGEEYGRMWSFGNKPSEKSIYEMASPCAMSDLPQSLLEPVLVREARKVGAEVRFGTEFVRLEDSGADVCTYVRDRQSKEEYTVRSKYLIGADGARSAVLSALDIPVDGVQLNTAFNVHIEADLSPYMINRPASLNWILNTDAPGWSAVGNFRMVKPWTEWVVSMHPARTDGEIFEPTIEQIQQRLHQMIGDSSVSIKVLSTFRWTINDQVARSWQKGRVMCIGDAVHRHPPINGLGSNTCISDAFNLAWKLAYVLRGTAGNELLDTLQVERKPVAEGVVRRANEGMRVHRRLWALLGLTPESRAEAIAALEDEEPAGEKAREQLRQAFEATDVENQALGMQMNQIYVGSKATYAEPDDMRPCFGHLNMLKQVAESTYPGYHLPHFWVAASGQAPRQSSLDLCGQGNFTILTGRGGACWLRAAQEVSGTSDKLKINGYSIGFRCDYIDCYNDWRRLSGTKEDGVVLVRPDHFVAWRYSTSSADATNMLRKALSLILVNPAIVSDT